MELLGLQSARVSSQEGYMSFTSGTPQGQPTSAGSTDSFLKKKTTINSSDAVTSSKSTVSLSTSGHGAHLVRALKTIPSSSLSGAQWATRSSSSSLDVTKSFLNTPLLTDGRVRHYPSTSPSSTVRGGRAPGSSTVTSKDQSVIPNTPIPHLEPIRNLHGTFRQGDRLGALLTPHQTSESLSTRKHGDRSTSSTDQRSGHTSSTSPGRSFAVPHPPPQLESDHDHSSDDLRSRDTSNQEDPSQIVMSLSWSQGKLGAAFYDITTAQVHVVEDKLESAPDFWILRTLFREQRPRWVLVGGRQDDRLFSVLRELCGVPATPLHQETGDTPPVHTPTQHRDENAQHQRQQMSGTSESSHTLSSTSSCSLRVLPMADFKYELCVRRVLSLALPGEPENATDAKRELYVRGRVNTDLVSMTRALGALMRFLDKHGLELLDPMSVLGGTPVLGLHVYTMEELAQLDEATAASLQLFSEDQHPAAFKSGKSSASKEGLSIFALLSRTACPMSSFTLRRVLLRPVVDREVLKSRYSLVRWGVDPSNLETLRNLHTCLKNITNVPHIISRLQRVQLSVRDWKTLYKSVFNSILVGEICQAQDQYIPIFKQVTEGMSEGLYHATFLIQRIMDMEQSEREARFVVKPGVDNDLDDKKRRFNGLGEVMRRVAEVELTHLPAEVDTCCIIYLPHVGYLLAFPPPPAFQDQLDASDYRLPGLEFMFKTPDMIWYKSHTCYELDRELGDLQVEIANHETRIMLRLVETLLQQVQALLALIDSIIMLDCLLSFAVVSRECGWVQPELTDDPALEVDDARHPLYELCTSTFVANPIRSGHPGPFITLITGPNASGKTVYLKLVGVIALLAQVGCWVPASRARLQPFDAIITVTQSIPPVTSPLSTFVLDLTRMCDALNRSTKCSLVLIDEFGAATYENDGAALLTACLDYWCSWALPIQQGDGSERHQETEGTNGFEQRVPPHMFVSTHLLQVYDHLQYPDTVKCLAMEAVEEEGRVVPLYQVMEGRARRSYAASVAAVAGVPPYVIERTNQVCEFVRDVSLPSCWSLLQEEDEEERRRYEAVVTLLLEHDLSNDPIHVLLSSIRQFTFPHSTTLNTPEDTIVSIQTSSSVVHTPTDATNIILRQSTPDTPKGADHFTHPLSSSTHPPSSSTHPPSSSTHPPSTSTHPSSSSKHPPSPFTRPQSSYKDLPPPFTPPPFSSKHPLSSSTRPPTIFKHPSSSIHPPSSVSSASAIDGDFSTHPPSSGFLAQATATPHMHTVCSSLTSPTGIPQDTTQETTQRHPEAGMLQEEEMPLGNCLEAVISSDTSSTTISCDSPRLPLKSSRYESQARPPRKRHGQNKTTNQPSTSSYCSSSTTSSFSPLSKNRLMQEPSSPVLGRQGVGMSHSKTIRWKEMTSIFKNSKKGGLQSDGTPSRVMALSHRGERTSCPQGTKEAVSSSPQSISSLSYSDKGLSSPHRRKENKSSSERESLLSSHERREKARSAQQETKEMMASPRQIQKEKYTHQLSDKGSLFSTPESEDQSSPVSALLMNLRNNPDTCLIHSQEGNSTQTISSQDSGPLLRQYVMKPSGLSQVGTQAFLPHSENLLS